MRKVFLYVVFIVILLSPFKIKAISCDNYERAKLRKIASNVMTSYTYIENNDTVNFKVTLTNMNRDIYIIDSVTGARYDYNGTNEITIEGYNPGTTIKYQIYAVKQECIKNYMLIKYVNLPNYNKYYKDPLCKDYTDYGVCAKWSLVNMSYDGFVKKVKSYADKEFLEVDTVEEGENIFDKIYEFLSNYYLYIVIGLGLIMFTILLLKNKKDDFNL